MAGSVDKVQATPGETTCRPKGCATGLTVESGLSRATLGDKIPARPPRGVGVGGRGGRGASASRARSSLQFIQESKSAFSYAVHREMNSRLEKTLALLSRNFDAERVRGCHSSFSGWACDHDHVWAKPVSSCRFKLCAFDSRVRAARLVKTFSGMFKHFSDPRYLVLSRRNCSLYELSEGLDQLWEAFEKLRHRRLWKRVRGAVVALELTFNRATQEWHPHLNVLFDGGFIAHAELLAEWNEINAGEAAAGVWIERANLSTLRELFKYVTKVVDFVDEPEAVRVFLRDTKRAKFLRTYGAFFGMEREEKLEPQVCPDCGSNKVTRVGYVAASQLWLDDGGVLRYARALYEQQRPRLREPGEEVEPFGLSPPPARDDVQRRIGFLGRVPEVSVSAPSLFGGAA